MLEQIGASETYNYGIIFATRLCVEILKKTDYLSLKVSFNIFGYKFDGLHSIYMRAPHITFHSSVDSRSSNMDLKSTKNHPNLHDKLTDATNY